jgi:anthranilate 1,2-dioxygenase small subunit/terephthalate 1,2-dioxygenase oxygenase component beta subunit
MMRDRINSLRNANVYESQRYRHAVGAVLIEPVDGSIVRAVTNFLVARIMHTGETTLFATGRYDDRIVLTADGAHFVEKTVILDSRQIDTLLAIPL